MPNGEQFETCVIEISPLADDLAVTMTARVYEQLDATEPVTIVRTDQECYVRVELTVTGKLRRHLCGQWCVCLYLESIGPAPEYEIPENCAVFDMEPCGDGNYSHTFRIPAGSIEADDCGTLYLVAVTLVAIDPCGDPGHIAGYCKGQTLMFYEGPPH